MKKLIVILLLSSYFFSTTELGQLLKVPVLVLHFGDHKENDNMSFFEFMNHHYGGHEQDADWDTDMKLPFMKHSDLLQLTVITPKSIFPPHQRKISIYKNQFSFYRDKFIHSSFLESIWQPPKSC